MNGSYYKNPMFNPNLDNRDNDYNPGVGIGVGDYEQLSQQSYIENILRMNRGKKATAYVSYSDSVEWRDRKFTGIIEQAGRDHLIMSDPNTGKWYLILMIYLDYVEFDGSISYKP